MVAIEGFGVHAAEDAEVVAEPQATTPARAGRASVSLDVRDPAGTLIPSSRRMRKRTTD